MTRSPERGRGTAAGTRIKTDTFTAARVRTSLVRILDDSPLCAIATVDARGRAHINTAYFAYSADFEFFFLSDSHSLHARNLGRDPSAAMAVFRSPQVWGGDDRGVQLFGACSDARGRVKARAREVYGRRFPAYARWHSGQDASEEQATLPRSYRFYRFVPRRFKILDEAQFGGAVLVSGTFQRRR